MANQAIIDSQTGEVKNIIVPWTPPAGCEVQDQGDLKIGDVCEKVNGVWQKIAV